MAYMVLVIDVPGYSIAQLNAKVIADASLPREGIEQSRRILEVLEGGFQGGTVQFTSRNSDPGVSTSGSGSLQKLWTKL
jgi:hypothetical protein